MIYGKRIQTTIMNCTFTNNVARDGGALSNYWYEDKEDSSYKFEISSSNFINNHATNGGAIYHTIYGKGIISNSCTFTNNSATNGGAIYVSKYSSYSSSRNNYLHDIKNSNFTNNHAEFYGGAIYLPNYDGQIWNCKFNNNSASEGGAVYIGYGNLAGASSGTQLKFLTSDFINNSALLGGAICNRDNIYYYRQPGRLEVASCNFIENTANNGGAIYDYGTKTYISNNVFSNNNALDGSNSIYMGFDDEFRAVGTNSLNVINFDKKMSGNIIKGDKSEIVFDKTTFGLVNLKILDITYQSFNKIATVPEGKVKLYATLKTKDGNYKVSVINTQFNFTVGNTIYPVTFNDGVAEIEYDAVVGEYAVSVKPSDLNNYKTLKYYQNSNGQIKYDTYNPGQPLYNTRNLNYDTDYNLDVTLKVVPMEYVIDFKDSEGEVGGILPIPVTVKDIGGNPAQGTITVKYLNSEFTRNLNSEGHVSVLVSLPTESATFDLTIIYKDTAQTHKITVVDPDEIVIGDLVIELPEEIKGHTGDGIIIPVKVHDGKNLYDGEITVQYSGTTKIVLIEDGEGQIVLSLPDQITEFSLIAQVHDAFATCKVKVVDNSTPIEEPQEVVIVNVPSKMVGHAGKTVIIPIKVYDGHKKPLNGTVSIYAIGGEFEETLQNGEGDFVLTLPNKVTNLQVIFEYGKFNAVTQIRVIDESSTVPTDDNEVIIIIGDGDDIVAPTGSNIQIPIYVHDANGNALSGDVKTTYGRIVDTLPLVEGRATAYISLPLNPTTNVFTVEYEGVSKSVFVDVVNTKNALGNLSQVESKQGGKIVINLPHDAEGTVTVNIGGKNYSGVVENGQVVIVIDDLPNGEYDATVHYSGDDTYSPTEKPVEVVIKDSNVTNPFEDLTEITSDDDGKITIPFPDDATGFVKVTINGKDYYGTVENGKVVLDTSDLPTGDYDAKVTYSGDHKYHGSEKTVPVTIRDDVDPTNPMRDMDEIVSGTDGKITIPFPSDATGFVKVTIDGKDYYGQIVDGKVVLDTKDIPAGNYNATVSYSGDSKYSASEKTVPITVNEVVDPNNPMGNVTEVTSTDDGRVEIPMPKDATGQVVVNINGKDYPAQIVDGKIVFDTKDVPQGNYNAIVKYLGDDKYPPSEKTVTMIVKEYHSSTTTNNNNNNIVKPQTKKASMITAKKKTFKKSLKVKKYSITLKSGKTAIKNVQLTIKVGKKTFNAKTNAKGKATFKIKNLTKKGKYNAVIKFKGNKTYKATIKKVKLTFK